MTAVCDTGHERRSYFDSNICRLCSFAKDKVLPIFDTSGSKFDAKINDCLSGIKITPGDGKPQHICFDCITKLNIYFEFLQMCIRSDGHFDLLIRSCKQKEQQEHSAVTGLHSQTRNNGHTQEQSDDLIVLSKVNPPLYDSIQDLVVVVELKYKDGTQPSASESQACLADAITLESTDDWNITKDDSRKQCNQELSVLHNSIDVQQNSTSICEEQQVTPPSFYKFDSNKKEYECTLCNKTFKKRTRLNSHLAFHTSIKPHKCNQCGKSFAMKWDLNIHLRIHRRDIACSRCDKAFSTKSKLERHFRIHTGQKPYGCTICGRNFSDKHNRDNHLRIHTGIKPYSCSVCSKAFSVRSHMVEHINVHNKTASFLCTICNKAFRWRANYRKHLKSHSLS